jgi:hypothetical protein
MSQEIEVRRLQEGIDRLIETLELIKRKAGTKTWLSPWDARGLRQVANRADRIADQAIALSRR